MSDKRKLVELANRGLRAYRIESTHKLNAVLNNVEAEILEDLNFKKSLASFKRHLKSLREDKGDVSPISVISSYAEPFLQRGFEFYVENPDEVTSLLNSVRSSANVDLRKYGVNEVTVGEFMRVSADGSVKDGFEFASDAVLSQLGLVPRLLVQEKLRQFRKLMKSWKSDVSNQDLQVNPFGLELALAADSSEVSVKDLLTEKDLANELSMVYRKVYGVSGHDYAVSRKKLASFGYTSARLLNEFKDSFISEGIVDDLKEFKLSGGGLVANLVNPQIDAVAKKNLAPTLNDYCSLFKSFGKHSLAQSVDYIQHFK